MRKIFIFFFISLAAVLCYCSTLFEGILQYWVDFIAQFLPKNVIHTFFCYSSVLVGLTQYVTVMAGIAIGKSWQTLFISLLARQKSHILGVFTTRTCCLQLLRSWRCGPERLDRGGPCWLLKLRCMGTRRVQMKVVHPWLVRWSCPAGTRDFCPALAALVGQVQNIFSSPYTISMPLFVSPSKLCRQPCWVAFLIVCVSGADRLKYISEYTIFYWS